MPFSLLQVQGHTLKVGAFLQQEHGPQPGATGLPPPCHTPRLGNQHGVRRGRPCSQGLGCPVPILHTGVLCRMKSGAVSNYKEQPKTSDHGISLLGLPRQRTSHWALQQQGMIVSHFWGQKPKIEVSAGLVPWEAVSRICWGPLPASGGSLLIGGVPGLWMGAWRSPGVHVCVLAAGFGTEGARGRASDPDDLGEVGWLLHTTWGPEDSRE